MSEHDRTAKGTFKKGHAKVPGAGAPKGSHHYQTRARMARIQRDADLDAAAVIEQIARGALYDPRDFFYAENGVEFYAEDGPTLPNASGELQQAWKKGDIKRTWEAGDIKPLHELTEWQAQSIAGFEVVMKNATAGDGKIDRVLKIKLIDRSKFVDMAGRYHALFREVLEVHNVDESVKRLQEGRLRALQRNRALHAATIEATVVASEPVKVERGQHGPD